MITARLFRRYTPTIVFIALGAMAAVNAEAQNSVAPAPTYAPVASPAISTSTAAGAAGIDVTTYRGDAERTGYIDCNVNLPLSVAWQNTTAASTSNLSSPTIHNDVIFFGAAGEVYAVNAGDGSIKWTFPSKDAETKTGLFDAPATIADGKVFIGNDDGKLYVLDEKSGESLWQVNAGTAIRTAPSVDGGSVFFGSIDGKLFAVREDNQQPLWGGSFKTLGPITTAPIVSNGNVYFADGNNTIYAAAEATGRLLWSQKYDYTVSDSPPLLGNGNLYFGSDRTMYGIGARTGAQRWRTDLQAATTAQAAISPDAGMIYVPTADGNLIALSAGRGQVKWTKALDSVATTAPTVTRNLIVVASKGGVVTGLDPATGATKWLYSLHTLRAPFHMSYSSNAGQVSATPLVADGAVYTLGNEGTLTAFQAGAVDGLKPGATLISPRQDEPVPGAQVPYLLYVGDIGSGIDPSSLKLTTDGKSLPVEYLPLMDVVRVKRETAGQLFGDVPVKLDTLASGSHRVSLTVSDWRGNRLVKDWSFTVDDGLNPADATPPPPASATPASSTDTSGDDSSSSAAPATPDAPVTGSGSPAASGSGGPTFSGPTPSTSGTAGAAAASPTPSAGSTVTAAGSAGRGSGAQAAPAPTPLPPPVAPPAAAGSGFPPPPPI